MSDFYAPTVAEEVLLGEAARLFREAAALVPRTPAALQMLAAAAQEASLPAVAEEILRGSLAIDWEHGAAHHLLGCALRDQGFYEASLGSFYEALALNAGVPAFHTDLADALRRLGRMEESEGHCVQALALDPGDGESHFMMGCARYRRGRFDDALASFRRAVACDPSHAAAHRNLAVALFLRGEFQEGYEHYEWRWKIKGFRGYLADRRRWNGESLAGKTLFVHAEQGLGDTLQFIRYVPLVEKEGGRIIVQVQPPLVRLLARIPGVDAIMARGDALPDFDVHCPLLSLPGIFGTTRATIPGGVAYIRSDSAGGELFPRAVRDPRFLNVGLAWSGNPRHSEDRMRSIPFALLGPLLGMGGVRFHRLHKRVGAEGREADAHPNLIDATGGFGDLADTAAYLDTLDLVISVDTVIAHLAGAMGKPTWTLIPFAPDWRWMLERVDSPWYPTMRLFRQGAFGEWGGVLREIQRGIAGLVSSGAFGKGRPFFWEGLGTTESQRHRGRTESF